MNRTFNNWLRCIGLVILLWVLACPLFAQLSISVSYGPPALPVYEQPACPAEGYMWTPGYWAWDPDYGYYWVPGTWVQAPQTGYLWTPPWWGWNNTGYEFHEGYWGPTVGFYGGINYGFGYYGNGFEGGRWQGDRFFYNRSAMNVNVTEIHNVYNTRIVNRGATSRVSYNGGAGGLTARPTAAQPEMETGRHLSPVAVQLQHRQQARGNPELRASANRGKPSIAATSRATSFTGHGVVAARAAGAPYHAPPASKENTTAKAGRSPEKAVGNRPGATVKESKPAATAERQETNPREAGPTEKPPRAAYTPTAAHRSVTATHTPPSATHTPPTKAHEEPRSAAPAPKPSPAPTHARELPPHEAPAAHANNTANEQKIHGQQEKLAAKQNQEHQTLARQQEREDQRAKQQNVQEKQQQQIEVRHQQQTQQMEQRHATQTKHVTERPAPAKPEPAKPATHENEKPH